MLLCSWYTTEAYLNSKTTILGKISFSEVCLSANLSLVAPDWNNIFLGKVKKMHALKLKENHNAYLSKWLKWGRQEIPGICKDLGQLEFLYMADESVNCYNHLGK